MDPATTNTNHFERDLHVYDRSLTHFASTTGLLTRHWSLEQKVAAFARLRQQLVEHKDSFGADHAADMPAQSVAGLDCIIRDTGQAGNFDELNQVRAEDLLADICYLLELQLQQQLHSDNAVLVVLSTLNNLAEQMADVLTLGLCSQGRCTRLRQIHTFLIDMYNAAAGHSVFVSVYFLHHDDTQLQVDIVLLID